MTNEIHIQVNVSPLLYISYRFFFSYFIYYHFIEAVLTLETSHVIPIQSTAKMRHK